MKHHLANLGLMLILLTLLLLPVGSFGLAEIKGNIEVLSSEDVREGSITDVGESTESTEVVETIIN